MKNDTANRKLSVLAFGMSEMAAKHPSDIISNALARVSEKIEKLGTPFAQKLDDTDVAVIKYYQSNR